MNDRPTPETDDAIELIVDVAYGNHEKELVAANFSRKLERERDKWMDRTTDALATVGNLTAERDELRASLKLANDLLSDYSNVRAAFRQQVAILEEERDELRAEVERLKADKARILEIVAREVALEDKDRPDNCGASHNRANNISDAIDAAMKGDK